jgi:hypothetical protein
VYLKSNSSFGQDEERKGVTADEVVWDQLALDKVSE